MKSKSNYKSNYTFHAWRTVINELIAERNRLEFELPRVHPDSYGAAERYRQLRRVEESLTSLRRTWEIDWSENS